MQLKVLLSRSLAGSHTARRWPLEAEVAATLEQAVRRDASTWVATFEDGEPVGALFTITRRAGSRCFIRWIVVDPTYRRCGIGERLIEALERATSAQQLTGMVDLDDPVASSFWRSRGFVTDHQDAGRVEMVRDVQMSIR